MCLIWFQTLTIILLFFSFNKIFFAWLQFLGHTSTLEVRFSQKQLFHLKDSHKNSKRMFEKKKEAKGISQITNFSMRIFYFIKTNHTYFNTIYFILKSFYVTVEMKNLHISWNREEKYRGINWHSVLKLDFVTYRNCNFILTSVC